MSEQANAKQIGSVQCITKFGTEKNIPSILTVNLIFLSLSIWLSFYFD